MQPIRILVMCPVLVASLTTTTAHSAEQTGFLELTEAQRVEVQKSDARATERGLLRKKLEGTSSAPVAAARGFFEGLANGELETASKFILDAHEKGLPAQLKSEEEKAMEAARQAMLDGGIMLNLASSGRARPDRKNDVYPTLDGDTVRGVEAAVRDIERHRAAMEADAVAYARRVLEKTPELSAVFDRLGITSASIRQRVSGRMREAAEWLHKAAIARINRTVLESGPEVIRSRFAKGGVASEAGSAALTAEQYLESVKADKAL